MPDVPFLPESEPTKRERAYGEVQYAAHVALTGRHYLPIRRPVLFLIVAVGIATALPVVALPALLLLALGDG